MSVPPTPAALQRIGPAARLPDLLAQAGVDARAFLAEFGLVPEEFTASLRLPFDRALALLDRAAAVSGRPDLGLMIGLANDHHCLDLVGEMMDCAPTLGEALADYVRVHGALSQAACAYLLPMGDWVLFGLGVYDRSAPGLDQFHAVVVAVASRIVLALSGGAVAPVEAHFSCRAPADPRVFERALKTEVRFNQPLSGLLLPRAALSAANPGADPARRAALQALLASRMNPGGQPVAERVRRFLRVALSLDEATLADAARHLALSERSLGRRLAEEGTSYARERDAVRYVMACELLALTDLAVGDIALALSYASHSAFVRSFRRWAGRSPSDWRREMTAPGAPASPGV